MYSKSTGPAPSKHPVSARSPFNATVIAASILVILSSYAGTLMYALAGTVGPDGGRCEVVPTQAFTDPASEAPVELEDSSDTTALLLEQGPVRGGTTIRFTLPRSGHTNVSLMDARGRLSIAIVDRDLARGTHSVLWNASTYPAGLYIVVIRMEGYVETGVLQVGG